MALPDYLRGGLEVVFVGTAVATPSASRGHYYAGPGNKFWEFLWNAGLTGERLLIPEQDSQVLGYGIGLTDLVKRTAASSDSLLRAGDFDVPGFFQKVEKYRPRVVAFNGRKAGSTVARYVRQPTPDLGRADWCVGSAAVWILPSSSGSSASPKHYAPKLSKSEWWREFGIWLGEGS